MGGEIDSNLGARRQNGVVIYVVAFSAPVMNALEIRVPGIQGIGAQCYSRHIPIRLTFLQYGIAFYSGYEVRVSHYELS